MSANNPPFALEQPSITTFKNDMTYAFMISWDDGDPNDLPISFIEDRYGFKHTSFLITNRMNDDNFAQWMSMLFRGHDIQVHGRTHTAIGLNLNESSIRDIAEGGALDLKDWLGYNPIAFAYPFGSVSENATEIVLGTYDYARGTKSEGFNSLGTWPILDVSDVKHSIGGLTGLQSTYDIPNIPDIYDRFLTMIERDGRGYQTYGAFKTYGHTNDYYMDYAGRDLFETELVKLSLRNDTWFTSWSEAWAYELVRTNTIIDDFSANGDVISFHIVPDYNVLRYPIEVTMKCEIPVDWTNPLVDIEGKTMNSPRIITEKGHRYILFNMIPGGQQITIVDDVSLDSISPEINNPRYQWISGDLIVKFDVTDSNGFIEDVNVSVTHNSIDYDFNLVESPLFWGNSTYGVVLFDVQLSIITLNVDVIDSNGNACSVPFTITP